MYGHSSRHGPGPVDSCSSVPLHKPVYLFVPELLEQVEELIPLKPFGTATDDDFLG